MFKDLQDLSDSVCDNYKKSYNNYDLHITRYISQRDKELYKITLVDKDDLEEIWINDSVSVELINELINVLDKIDACERK